MQLSAGLTADNKIKLAENLKWEIQDGLIKFGVKLTGEGKLEISYVIYKEVSPTEELEYS